MNYRVVVFDSAEAFRSWQVWPTDDSDPSEANRDKATLTGEVPLFIPEHRLSFHWMCPGCGVDRVGRIGDTAVSGWDSPCWVLTGTDDKPNLTPSLGCGGWRNGICPEGHFWLRDGELVPA